MQHKQDDRIVMTLDAGGTNFVFCAVQYGREIIQPLGLPARGSDLEETLNTIIEGFRKVRTQLPRPPAAISFAFPGPAEYERGIIGDLENLPAFHGGVALGPMLEDEFRIPAFINNDGDLFAYGEAIGGLLPEINALLKKHGSPKRYRNLFGATFGTGFGGGIVSRGLIFRGDNSAQAEINRMRNRLYPNCSVEESVSIRGVKRVYVRESGIDADACPSPKTIFEIGMGVTRGNRAAAVAAFEELGTVAGDAFGNAITLVDGLIVIGGGLAGAHRLFMTRLVEEMNSHYDTFAGKALNRLEVKAFNLENGGEREQFVNGAVREIGIPHSSRKIQYDPLQRIGVGVSRLGTAKAVSIGAYAFALHELDKKNPH
jgi:glucokinase